MWVRKKEYVFMIVRIMIGIMVCLPVILAIFFSFQGNQELGSIDLHIIPENPTLENYKYVLTNTPVFTYLKNTMVMLIVCIPCQVILGSLAAYSFAFFDYPGKKFLFSLYLAVMMIPGEVVIMANYATIQNMGLVDTYAGLTITGLIDIGCLFMLRQHMLTLPKALKEAAELDGCGHMKFYFNIVMPLSKSIIVAQVLSCFISVYNSYFWPLLVTSSDNMRTVQTGVANLMRDSDRYVGSVLAGALLSMIVPVIIYIFGMNRIVEGMTAGSVKS